jgi:uncharacterized membrane protein
VSTPGRPEPPIDLSAGRLEAFSDAVMAVIITILALGLHAPEGANWPAVIDDPRVLPNLAIYVLSFTFIAIYWNNHHHLLRATTLISGGVMWANMVLLFCLSLIPVAAEWLSDYYHESLPAAFFGLVGLASALAYSLLVRAIIRANGRDSLVGTAIHADLKGKLSLAMYAAGIALAFLNVWFAYALYAAVAIMWLVPDRRFTHAHADGGSDEP